MDEMRMPPGVEARPYQLMCVVCALGQRVARADDDRINQLRETVRSDPEIPITLRCNAGSIFAYQDPGTAEDTPEGADYNVKRDLDILRQLDLAPGSTLPARVLFTRLLDRIAGAPGICGYDTVTGDAWQGCVRTREGFYEEGRAMGIAAIIPPRDEQEMAAEMEKSIEALRSATRIDMRPHLLLCGLCQYGDGVRPPFAEDNIPEFLDLVFNQNRDLEITLVPGADWMMCAPCPYRSPDLNACITGRNSSGGLYNQTKDLNVLRELGLSYGTTMKARDFYRLALEKIPSPAWVCALDNTDLQPYSVWFNACDARQPWPRYENARAELLKKMESWSG